MVNLYKTTTLLGAIESKPKVFMFFRDTFFPGVKSFTTEDVMVDYKKGKRRMAPFVAPRVGGVTIERDGFKTEKISAPRLAPQRPMTIDDISNRLPGEGFISTKSPADRQKELLKGDISELSDSIDRREEFMAVQVMFEGKVDLSGYTGDSLKTKIEQEVDYGFENKETLSGTSLWTDKESDPYSDLERWSIEVSEKSGAKPNIAIFGKEAVKAFRNNTKIKDMFDKRNMNFGQIKPSIVNDVVSFIGKIDELGLEFYTYSDCYLDDEDELHPFVPVDKVLLAKKGSGAFGYGSVTQIEKEGFVTYEGRIIPKQWVDQNNDTLMLRLSSRPVPIPGDVDGWFVGTVVNVEVE